MTADALWSDLRDTIRNLPSAASHQTPRSHRAFRIANVRESHVCVEYEEETETVSLERGKFETLAENVTETDDGFDLDRLPPNADPYATVLALLPEFELDAEAWVLRRTASSPDARPRDTRSDSDERTHQRDTSDPSIETMLDNMGDPQAEVRCPIDGCQYRHRSAASVARHVSGSSTAKHIWENTDYAGWRDFVRKHGEEPG
ncbi:hypothetical protein VB773_12590 [Haloarculaceae archaeon H-GB2-1]|nr:hypothetical protein [Haloarculaceae archaeon H-GB1-1]MEA5408311.1 hypothetical protein [Haloarculaceae archaeon H-GB2-1]